MENKIIQVGTGMNKVEKAGRNLIIDISEFGDNCYSSPQAKEQKYGKSQVVILVSLYNRTQIQKKYCLRNEQLEVNDTLEDRHKILE